MLSTKEIFTSPRLLFAALLLAGPVAQAQEFRFTTIDAPNSIFTVARAVNSQSDIVGWSFDTGFKQHGYLLSNGNFTQLDFNNDVNRPTTALGLNTGGDIVGFFRNSTGVHGFLVNKGGLMSFTTIDFPGATFTLATAINDSGQIVGLHGDSAFVDHAFVRSPAGTFTAVADVPGAVDSDSWAIDNTGRIAGFYDEFGRAALNNDFTLPNGRDFPFPAATLHGFLRDGSSITRVNISGVSGGINTCIFGINDSGVIVGQYDSPDGRTHGFVGTPK